MEGLTKREQAVVVVLKEKPAATNAEIGAVLGKSDRTVENQLRRLYKRLNITGDNKRLQLITLILRGEI